MDEEHDDGDVVEYPRYAARLNSCDKDSSDSYVPMHLHHLKSRLGSHL